MDEFSRSLAAAALIDGRRFSLPGHGTLAGEYLSARINHVERHVEPPSLEVTWSPTVSAEVPTFAELLSATGATTAEAEGSQRAWLEALALGSAIEIGDLGTLQHDAAAGRVVFTAKPTALERAYWANGPVDLEPLEARAEAVAAPTTPVVPIALAQASAPPAAAAVPTSGQVAQPAIARPTRARRAWLVPAAIAATLAFAALVIFSVAGSDDPDDALADAERGQVVAVRQDRLNRSPREDAVEEAPDDDFVDGDYASEGDAPYAEEPGDLAFDPAGLAGEPDADEDYAFAPIEAVIVLGSFGNADNAARLTEQVAGDGLLPYVDQNGELTRVGVAFEAETEDDIAAMMQRLRAEYNPSAWLLD